MKIGIDLDGVVFDTEKEYRVYSELYDIIELRQNSKKNEREIKFQERFDWTEEQKQDFFKKYLYTIMENGNFMPGAKEVLKMLKKEGNELVVITARGGYDSKIIDLTMRRLKEANMDIFDKYFWATEDKEKKCQEENIDVMIDDSCENIKAIANEGIKTIYLKDAPNYDLEETENIKTLYNWGEIYRELGKKHEKSCGCVIIKDDKVVIIKQTKGHYGFPKGHIEEGETEIETATREVKEETNIDVKVHPDRKYEEEYITDKGTIKKVIYFIADMLNSELKPQEEEVAQIELVSFDEALEKITYEDSKRILREVMRDLGKSK